jgi:2-C-methyl-D-erythritol 4-phosphate cytidylyltransferase/2-C-methyl-D-erythritol 2,4-cyclodiphosphate synthase
LSPPETEPQDGDPALPSVDVIVVAAGASTRMGGTDKLDERIGGRPLLAWTLSSLAASSLVERIVVVTAADQVAALGAAAWLPDAVVAVVPGAARRQGSVAAGLAALEGSPARGGGGGAGAPDDDRIVLVHDGARPLVSPELIEAIARATHRHGAAIPVLGVTETIKRVEEGRIVETVDRSNLASAQTPQGVRAGLLRAAYRERPPAGPETWTDEAALLEACRIPVHAVPGDPRNLKVTVPADLDRVRSALGGAPSGRVGIGHDSHPFGPAESLALGGIAIAGAPRLHGHSDGDVALHAVCDALLGAAGLGDLGRLFPAGPTTERGIASRALMTEVVRRVGEAGWRPLSIDLTIVAGRPRLGAHLDKMRDAVAGLTGLAPGAVNVKASTGNLDGMEGAGRGISALAVATIEAAG